MLAWAKRPELPHHLGEHTLQPDGRSPEVFSPKYLGNAVTTCCLACSDLSHRKHQRFTLSPRTANSQRAAALLM